jgi:hypothetical protein
MKESLRISKRKQKKFHCESERERNAIEARKTSSHPTSLPIEVPNRDPIIRSYNEVPFEISETRSHNEVPIEMSKPLYFSTVGTVQGT